MSDFYDLRKSEDRVQFLKDNFVLFLFLVGGVAAIWGTVIVTEVFLGGVTTGLI